MSPKAYCLQKTVKLRALTWKEKSNKRKCKEENSQSGIHHEVVEKFSFAKVAAEENSELVVLKYAQLRTHHSIAKVKLIDFFFCKLKLICIFCFFVEFLNNKQSLITL